MMSTNSSDQLVKQLADLSVSSVPSSAASSPRPSQVTRSMTDTTVLHCSTEQHSSVDSDEAIIGLAWDSEASQNGDSAKSDRIEEVDDEEGAKKINFLKQVLASDDIVSNSSLPIQQNNSAVLLKAESSEPVPIHSPVSNRSRQRGFTHSCTRNNDADEYNWMASPPEFSALVEQPVDDVGWVASWATDFDILLADPIGLKAFTDFLCKEFSYENLQFFLAIQEFKKLDFANQDEIRAQAHDIYQMYISNDATDPVNVDSKARKAAEVGLEATPVNNRVFALPEKQIYNLMKFDSYQRFLKSDIFKECASLDLLGKSLPYESDSAVHNEPNEAAAATGAEMKAECKSKRKSIIPWARIKSSLSNVKGASFSSMPNKESRFRRPMQKFASSLTKIRSKSFDEYMHHRVRLQVDGTGSKKGHVSVPEHSTSIDKTGCSKQSLNLTDSLVSGSSSLDLSEHDNVFSQCDITKQIMLKTPVTPVKPQRAQPFFEKFNKLQSQSLIHRFNSVSNHQQVVNGKYTCDCAFLESTKLTTKASHLRELQNHANFKSCVCEPNGAVVPESVNATTTKKSLNSAKVNQTQSTQQSRPPLLSAISVSHKSLPSSLFQSLDQAHHHHHPPHFVQCV